MTDADILEGGCMCGLVRFMVQGSPRWVAHCHCSSCRRASGGAFVTWLGARVDAFTVVKGTPARFASSPGVVRTYCARCGSRLTYESTRWPDEIHIAVGGLDQPALVTPSAHVNFAEALPWLALDDELPRHPGFGDDA